MLEVRIADGEHVLSASPTDLCTHRASRHRNLLLAGSQDAVSLCEMLRRGVMQGTRMLCWRCNGQQTASVC